MDFTKKFKSLVLQVPPARPSHGTSSLASSSSLLQLSQNPEASLVTVSPNQVANLDEYIKEKELRELSRSQILNDPEVEADILKSVADIYYRSDEEPDETNRFRADDYMLENLPDHLTLDFIIQEKDKLRKQLLVVSKRVSDLILQKQPSYAQELDRVTDLQKNLSETIKICTRARGYLNDVKHGFTYTSLGIVANYKRREILSDLLQSVLTIKTLQQTDVRLRELLDEDEDFPGSIQLCLECQKVVANLRHYKCIGELSSKLQDTLEMTEEQIDITLSKMCTSFNSDTYYKLQMAYKLFGKIQTAMDQLLMHFAGAIHNKAFSIVLGYVELYSIQEKNRENFQKKQYSELCRFLNTDCFIPCLIDLCKSQWLIMLNYKKILLWHQLNDVEVEASNNNNDENDDSGLYAVVEDSFNKRYIKQKLEHGLSRVWQDILQKLRILIQSTDLSVHRFNEFIKVLRIVYKMIDVGQDFCGSKSEELQELIRIQTISYFVNYHRSSMDELRVFLESEMWTICPVKSNFSLFNLQEFQFLKVKQRSDSSISDTPSKSNCRHFNRNILTSESTATPFDFLLLKTEEDSDTEINRSYGRDISSDSDEEVQDELKHALPADGSVAVNAVCNNSDSSEGPIVTNTTLNVLRLLGRYMQMMSVLDAIAFDVLLCMFHLFDYYLFAAFRFFGEEMSMLSGNSVSQRLKVAIQRVKDHITSDVPIDNDSNKFLSPSLSPHVDLGRSENLYGLPERLVAIESLIVLANQFTYLKDNLEQLIPPTKQDLLRQYFTKTVSVASDLRIPIYRFVAVKCIEYEQVLNMMTSVRWDVKDIMSQHNSYVDFLLRKIQTFIMRMNEICNDTGINLPQEANDIIWSQILLLVNWTFVEGFSQSKKCTHEGRALMQLDYQQYVSKIEKISPIRPLPERELVEEYIKAYYLPEQGLEQWIRTRKTKYKEHQFVSVVSCFASDNKRVKQRLLQFIDKEFGQVSQ